MKTDLMYFLKYIFVTTSILFIPNMVNAKSNLIGGGERANIEDFPWQVLILTSTKNGIFMCGGFLVSSRFVMTAAHCLMEKEEQEASFPSIYLGTTNLIQPQKSNVKKIFPHPDYDELQFSVVNDIALILLESAVEFSRKIRPIKIPSKKFRSLYKYSAMISGYGFDESNEPTFFLNYANVTILRDVECKLMHLEYDSTQHICVTGADGINQGVCFGDTGGALVIKYKDDMIAVGVASYLTDMNGKCFTANPMIFTRIQSFIPWITEVIDRVISGLL